MGKKKALFSIIQEWSEGKLSLPKLVNKAPSAISGGGKSENKTGAEKSFLKSKADQKGGITTAGTSGGSVSNHGTSAGLKTSAVSSSGAASTGSSSSAGLRAGSSGGKGRSSYSSGPKVIVKSNYIKGVKRVGLHLKYIENRQHDERSELFGKEKDNLDRLWFTNRLGKYDNIHRIVISPADKGVDLKELVREIMKRFEKKKERDLIWIAAIHKDPKHTSHPHVHLVVSGTDTKGRKLRMERPDINFLKEKSSEFISREKSFFSAIERAVFDNSIPRKEKKKELDLGL